MTEFKCFECGNMKPKSEYNTVSGELANGKGVITAVAEVCDDCYDQL